MLIECPKCGFSQPKDQYCANCGVNLTLAEPKRDPLWKILWQNQWLQLLLSLGAAFFVLSYLLYSFRQEIANRLTSSHTSTRTHRVAEDETQTDESEDVDQAAANKSVPYPSSVAAQKKKVVEVQKIRLVFAEMSRESFDEQATGANSFDAGDARAVTLEQKAEGDLVQQLGTQLTNLGADRTVPLSEQPSQTHLRYLQPVGGGGEIGLVLDVDLEKVGTLIKLHVVGSTLLPLRSGGLGRRNVDLTVDMQAGNGLILGAILPENAAPLGTQFQELMGSPLRMMASEEFKTHPSELVLIVAPSP